MSVVSKKFGEEIKTPYSGNALNRLSFKREDQKFLHNALHAPDARFLAFLEFDPLLNQQRQGLHWATASEIGPEILGDPFALSVEELAARWDPQTDASGCSHAQLVFLGTTTNGDSPRFAVDVTAYEQARPELRSALQSFANRATERGLGFEPTYAGLNFDDANDFSIVAEGRILLDWINRTRFCGGCGRRNMVVWGGFKLLCPMSFTGAVECPTHGKVTNLSFPRTDCCVIVAIMSHDGSKVLIGKGVRFRRNMYSCLAGFLESGESIEDCVRREAYEEAGVKVGTVRMLASQPWPFPANLMIGCVAEIADESPESHEIFLGHDNELLDAKWIPLEDLRRLCAGEGDYGFTVPPKTSIAWTLLDLASQLR